VDSRPLSIVLRTDDNSEQNNPVGRYFFLGAVVYHTLCTVEDNAEASQTSSRYVISYMYTAPWTPRTTTLRSYDLSLHDARRRRFAMRLQRTFKMSADEPIDGGTGVVICVSSRSGGRRPRASATQRRTKRRRRRRRRRRFAVSSTRRRPLPLPRATETVVCWS